MPGVTICGVMIVNNPGKAGIAFGFLDHAKHNGFTPADFVFPAFLCMIGRGVMMAYTGSEAQGHTRASLFRSSMWRASYLFAIGLGLDALYLRPLHSMYIFGVLQRVALCLAISSVLLLGTRPNLRRPLVLVSAFAVCLIGYWILMRFVPVPGFGVPGRDVPLLDPSRNLAAWCDRRLFSGHLLNGSYDPDGLLSTTPAIGTFLIGMLLGLWLETSYTVRQKALGIVAAGLAFLLAGALWNKSFPINMQLWTSSYVLWAGGWTLLVFAVLFCVADVLNVRGKAWILLLVFGTNAMASYILADAISTSMSSLKIHGQSITSLIYDHTFSHIASPGLSSIFYALSFTGVCWLLISLLYRRKVFLNI